VLARLLESWALHHSVDADIAMERCTSMTLAQSVAASTPKLHVPCYQPYRNSTNQYLQPQPHMSMLSKLFQVAFWLIRHISEQQQLQAPLIAVFGGCLSRTILLHSHSKVKLVTVLAYKANLYNWSDLYLDDSAQINMDSPKATIRPRRSTSQIIHNMLIKSAWQPYKSKIIQECQPTGLLS
jgi:hypothetical protein